MVGKYFRNSLWFGLVNILEKPIAWVNIFRGTCDRFGITLKVVKYIILLRRHICARVQICDMVTMLTHVGVRGIKEVAFVAMQILCFR